MNNWEKRWNPLRKEWVIYAAHRNNRPWEGEISKEKNTNPPYLSDCYLCPGNQRISGNKNPHYEGIFTFDNDHPVVGQHAPDIDLDYNDLYKTESAKGFSKVICYHPNHNKTMTDLSLQELINVMQEWKKASKEAKLKKLKQVLIFENKGKITGVSNLHPHCQIYATDFIFKNTAIELEAIQEHRKKTNSNLHENIILTEQKAGLRIIAENEFAIAFIPFFARYAYEVMVFPKRHFSTMIELTDSVLNGIAEVFEKLLKKYDDLFEISFPYVLTVMQAPFEEKEKDYRLYFHFQPPLRQPGVRKYLAGPEIGGGNFMADTMPEVSAAKLNGKSRE